MKIYAFIFARENSVGCKNKNIRILGNKPLIAHSIELAKRMSNINKVIVSTDSSKIAEIAKQFGADIIINRPVELATSESKELDSWKHAIKYLNNDTFDLFISLPCVAPLRTITDINNCIKSFITDKSDLLVTTTKDEKFAWMCTIDKQNYIKPYNNEWVNRRQEFKKDIRLITPVCYISRPSHILNINHVLDGNVSTYLIPYERSIDIDSELDFKIVESIIY